MHRWRKHTTPHRTCHDEHGDGRAGVDVVCCLARGIVQHGAVHHDGVHGTEAQAGGNGGGEVVEQLGAARPDDAVRSLLTPAQHARHANASNSGTAYRQRLTLHTPRAVGSGTTPGVSLRPVS